MDEKEKLKQCINKVLAGELIRTMRSTYVDSDCFDASPPKSVPDKKQQQTAASISIIYESAPEGIISK